MFFLAGGGFEGNDVKILSSAPPKGVCLYRIAGKVAIIIESIIKSSSDYSVLRHRIWGVCEWKWSISWCVTICEANVDVGCFWVDRPEYWVCSELFDDRTGDVELQWIVVSHCMDLLCGYSNIVVNILLFSIYAGVSISY